MGFPLILSEDLFPELALLAPLFSGVVVFLPLSPKTACPPELLLLPAAFPLLAPGKGSLDTELCLLPEDNPELWGSIDLARPCLMELPAPAVPNSLLLLLFSHLFPLRG